MPRVQVIDSYAVKMSAGGMFPDRNIERRKAKRYYADIAATVVYDSGRVRVQAQLKNISATGAKVELAGLHELPVDFYMLIPQHRLQPCRLVWQAGGLLGLQFSNALA